MVQVPLPKGDLSEGLKDFLVAEVCRLASQFLTICIRAVDFCPPVNLLFGDYLRAIITADQDLIPDDDWAYREAIIHAFGERGIYGQGTASMTEEELAWNAPRIPVDPVEELSFGQLKFDGDPAKPVNMAEMRRQAGAIGRLVTRPELAQEFGLVSPESIEFSSGEYDLPVVESVRTARRVGPDKQLVFDLVAEVIQTRRVRDDSGQEFAFLGGSTVILGPQGEVRFAIRKRVDNEEELSAQRRFMRSAGRPLWQATNKRLTPIEELARRLCLSDPAGASVDGRADPSTAQQAASGNTVILIVGPAHLPGHLQVMVDGRFSTLETGRPAEIAVGDHTFQINYEGERYRIQRHCAPGGTQQHPLVIPIDSRV